MSTFASMIQRGTRAAQPAAASVPVGTIYFVTDEGVTERSSGSAWETFSDVSVVANDSVTYAKMQNVSAASRLLGRGSAAGAGDPQEISIGTGLSMAGTTLSASGGTGTVDTSGTPATGNLAKFADADTITNADLTGDVTTGGGVATTIANDAVTYAKMQNVSAASKLLGRGSAGGAGDPEEITLGTGLTMTGTTLAASGGGGSGALVLLEQHTASGSASLDFTTGISATYDEYMVEFVDVAPATNNVDLLMLLSTNGGSSYDSGANYARQTRLDQSTFNTVAGGNSGLTALIAITNVSNGATYAVNLSGKLWAPGSTAHYKTFTFQGIYRNNDGSFYSFVGAGTYISTTAVNAFQVKFSSGNIASGTVRLYGIAKT